MEEIRVKRGIEVKVNDAGDTIIMNVEDQLFLERFYGLLDRMKEAEDVLKTQEVRDMEEHDRLKIAIEKTRGIMGGIDEIFGVDSCKKIFGDIVPNMYLIADFFSQIEPITRKYMRARRSEIDKKYGRSRKEARYQNRHGKAKRNQQKNRDDLTGDTRENSNV